MVACRSAEYIKQFIRLVENGEERLIQGVGSGIFSIYLPSSSRNPMTPAFKTS